MKPLFRYDPYEVKAMSEICSHDLHLADITERTITVLALKTYLKALWFIRSYPVLRNDIKATVRVLRKMPTCQKISR